MFEAIHGSAPRMMEEGIGEYANPASINRAAVMMLRHIGFTDKAAKLEKSSTRRRMPLTCRATGPATQQKTSPASCWRGYDPVVMRDGTV